MAGPDSAAFPEYVAIPASNAALTGRAVGLDIGGTGIKAAVVDLATGELLTARIREVSPQPGTPDAVMAAVASVFATLDATDESSSELRAGAAFPSVIRGGRAMTAVHGVASWVGIDVGHLLAERLGRPFAVLNDADALAVAEIIFGGGMAKDFPTFGSRLRSRAPIVPATLGTNAGIVGAARVGSAADPRPAAEFPS